MVVNYSGTVHDQNDKLEVSDIVNIFVIFAMVSGLLLGLSIGNLFVYQMSNLSKNRTTVEEMILTKVDRLSPFNTGSAK